MIFDSLFKNIALCAQTVYIFDTNQSYFGLIL